VEPERDGPPDPATVYDERGVDRSLVRWMLSLTPAERLSALCTSVRQFEHLRAGLVPPSSAQ
jgi:hypothetical protein